MGKLRDRQKFSMYTTYSNCLFRWLIVCELLYALRHSRLRTDNEQQWVVLAGVVCSQDDAEEPPHGGWHPTLHGKFMSCSLNQVAERSLAAANGRPAAMLLCAVAVTAVRVSAEVNDARCDHCDAVSYRYTLPGGTGTLDAFVPDQKSQILPFAHVVIE